MEDIINLDSRGSSCEQVNYNKYSKTSSIRNFDYSIWAVEETQFCFSLIKIYRDMNLLDLIQCTSSYKSLFPIIIHRCRWKFVQGHTSCEWMAWITGKQWHYEMVALGYIQRSWRRKLRRGAEEAERKDESRDKKLHTSQDPRIWCECLKLKALNSQSPYWLMIQAKTCSYRKRA